MDLAAAAVTEEPPRVGNIVIAVGRSWSNAVTASAGIIAVIGGPLYTGRRRSIAEVIRTTAPMHGGFAGGALIDGRGGLIGITTAAAIRGLGVVIPAPIVSKAVSAVMEHGGARRGYLGVAGQAVELPEAQRGPDGDANALLVVAVTAGSPAAEAGIMIGDVLVSFDTHRVISAGDLLALLGADRIGSTVPVEIRRGGAPLELNLTIRERPRG